jgi:hypothetical protein
MCDHHDTADTGTSLGRRDLLRGAAAGALALAAGACATNPETGRSQFIMVDDAQMQQAALQAWAQQLQRGAPGTTPPLRPGSSASDSASCAAGAWEFRLSDREERLRAGQQSALSWAGYSVDDHGCSAINRASLVAAAERSRAI